MKKLTIILFASAVLVLFTTANSSAQVVVKKPLKERHVVMVRPPRPSEKHFWVEGEWVPKGGTYIERPAHWAIAPHPHALRLDGEWRRHKGGYIWIPGVWK